MNRNAPAKKEKPLIDSILEDISLERLKKQQLEQSFTPVKAEVKQTISDFTKATACDSISPFKTSAQKLFGNSSKQGVPDKESTNKLKQILPLIQLLSQKKAKQCQPFEGSAGPNR